MKTPYIKTIVLSMVLVVCSLFIPMAYSQTATISPITQQYWAGVNTTNTLVTGSNSVTFASPDASVFNLSVLGQPAGLTTVLSTNLATNTISLGLKLIVTNVAGGAYPLSINGSGGSYASYSTNINLFVVPQWMGTNAGSSNGWSSAAKWSSGVVPTSTDGIYFDHSLVGPYTNVVDSSQTIQSLVYLGDADDAALASGVFTTIANGSTLSILGTNGFAIGRKNEGDSA